MFIIYDDFYLKHNSGPFHPESPNRLVSIIGAIKNWNYDERRLIFQKPCKAEKDQIKMVHDEEYIKLIKTLSKNKKLNYLDADTVVNKHTYMCALMAAGGGFTGIDLILKKNTHPDSDSLGNANLNSFFLMARPPGHHAFRDRGSGFCIFNNIALAAEYTREKYGLKRILIIDFDAHHGNGTQDIFYLTNEVFYVSFHQYPHYPGSGTYLEAGELNGKGYNINFPFSAGTGDSDYLFAFKEIILPLADRFEPQLILISAGYDSHYLDPLSDLNLTSSSYFKIMSIISYMGKKYCKGKTGIFLEGGYDAGATSESVIETIKGFWNSYDNNFKSIEELMEFINIEDKMNIKNISNYLLIENIKKLFKINDF